MAKLPTIQLLFVILQFALLISKTFVFSQSVTQSSTVDQSESNSQSDLNRNQSSTADSTTTATPMSENLTNSISTTDNTDENIFLYLNTESSSESIPTTTVAPEQPESDPFDYNLFFCTCDLIGGQCDVNCCCDPDCSPDDLRLFNRCWSPPSSYFDRYYCSPDPDRYGIVWNNTPEFRVQWTSRSGMFCIVTDNVPKKRLFEEKAPVTEDELFKQMSPKLSGRWSDPESQPISTVGLEQWIYQPYYKEGSPIFTLHINGIVSVLKLPRSLNSASCNTAQTVHFLESFNDHQCSLPGEDRCDPTIRLEEWLANLAVFRLPSYSVSSNGNGNSSARWGDMDKLAPVVVRICGNSNSGCRSDLPAPEPSCRNSLTAVTLRITHNGTEGIRSVLADLLYASSAAGPVRFQTIHQSLGEMSRPIGGAANNPLRTRSGNPGYLMGKPLVVAKLNSSSGEGAYQTLDVFPGTPKSRLIRFGEDSYHAFRMNGIKMDNRTLWCTNWSQFVLESFWGPQLQLLRLGAFGNVELNETENSGLWLAIRIQTDELSCFDSLIQGELVVVYAKSGSYDQPQNKLLGAGLQLRSSGADCLVESSNRCSLQLIQTVSFVMSDSPTFMVLPQPPRWKIQLPHDFFYPFLLSSAGSAGPMAVVTLPLLLVVVFYGH